MRFIPCMIEMLHTEAEDYWEISVPSEYASEAALGFAAMHLDMSEKIVFGDRKTLFTIRSDSVTLDRRTIAVDINWLEAVWCLFLKTHQNGWTHTAHIDQNFSDKNGSLCITIRLTHPA